MKKNQNFKMDKTSFSISSLSEMKAEKNYWLKKTPLERLEALEINRQVVYGYHTSSLRFQRILKITKLKKS